MGTLYVDRQGMTLRMRDGVIELRAEGERPRSMPGSLIDRVVLRADTQRLKVWAQTVLDAEDPARMLET